MKKIIFLFSISLFLICGVFFFKPYTDIKKEMVSQNEFNPETFNWQQNGEDGEYVVMMIDGQIKEETKALVLTDENCEVDEEGISRCNQKIEFENGEKGEFIMPHNMMVYRCLRPGEIIKIVPYEEDGFVKAII